MATPLAYPDHQIITSLYGMAATVGAPLPDPAQVELVRQLFIHLPHELVFQVCRCLTGSGLDWVVDVAQAQALERCPDHPPFHSATLTPNSLD